MTNIPLSQRMLWFKYRNFMKIKKLIDQFHITLELIAKWANELIIICIYLYIPQKYLVVESTKILLFYYRFNYAFILYNIQYN